MVITNSFFTPNAVQLAKANQIELWDIDKLTDIMAAANGKTIADKVASEHKDNSKTCPRCKAKLVLRNDKRGQFWGCSSYPKCRYTADC